MSQKLNSIFLLSILLLTACRRDNNASLPNPASVFCLEQGGTHEIRPNPDGSQTGFCLFPDGSECEEWAFFNTECGPKPSTELIEEFSTEQPPALANPASAFCLEQGGTHEIRTNPDGSQTGFCHFPDGSACEEWAFFNAECGPVPTPELDDDLTEVQPPALANPASVFCQQNSGESILVTNPDGSVTGFCEFPDGTLCDEWEFFRGECDPPDAFTPVEPRN